MGVGVNELDVEQSIVLNCCTKTFNYQTTMRCHYNIIRFILLRGAMTKLIRFYQKVIK